MGQPAQHRDEQVQGAASGHGGFAGDHMTQGGAIDVLEYQVHHTIGGLALVEHGHHIRVLQPGGGLCLALGALHEPGVIDEVGVDDLEGHVAVEPLVKTHVDGGCSARGQSPLDPVTVIQQRAGQAILGGLIRQIAFPERKPLVRSPWCPRTNHRTSRRGGPGNTLRWPVPWTGPCPGVP